MSNDFMSGSSLRVSDEELDFDDDFRKFLGYPFTGVAYDNFLNGNTQREISCLNGLPDGVCREWYPDGQIHKEWTARRGPVHGTCTEWYLDGSLKSIANYLYGVEVDYKEWAQLGDLLVSRKLNKKSPMQRLIKRLEKVYSSQ